MPESYRKRFQGYFLNPFLLALIPSLVFFLILPFHGKKYDLENIGSTVHPEKTRVFYNDLDNDGWSEKILVFSRFNSSGVTLYRRDNIIDQWNVGGTINFPERSTLCIPADCDGNGIKEIYFFTLSGDSVFLNSVGDNFGKDLAFSHRFLAKAGKGINMPDPYIIEAEPDDLNGDGLKELIFGIATGFSKYPRQIFAYYLKKDSLVISPESSSFIYSITQADINGDGFRELIPGGYGASNVAESEAKYHDQSGWLMVLDRNLDFLFEPVEIKGQYSGVTPLVYIGKNDTIISALTLRTKIDSFAFLLDFNPRGEIIYNEMPEVHSFTGFITTDRQKGPLYVIQSGTESYQIFDKDRKLIRAETVGLNPRSITADLDLDGEDEILMLVDDGRKLAVYRSGLRNRAEAVLNAHETFDYTFSVKHSKDRDPVISLQFGNMQQDFVYRKNAHYFLALFFYPVTYAGFFLFIYLILLLQKKSFDRKLATEKKIAELQLAMLRNQLEPHFILNAINSIVYLVQTSDNDKATEGLRSFSSLYRDMVLSGSETRRTLGEEIEFCRNYLILEKIRYGERLNYGIYITPGTNLNYPVPKMILQLYAENAVKHGISKLEKGGHIDIIVTGIKNGYSITISDNGAGRGQAPDENNVSTGKGMALMQELFGVYNRYYREKISVELVDLNNNGKPAGTKVIITIAERHN